MHKNIALENEYGIEEEVFQRLVEQQKRSHYPERYILGKKHPDRARQFKPFAALQGYEELIEQVMAEANEPHDFVRLEESC